MKAVKQPPHEFHMYTGSVGYAAPRILPSAEALRRAADVLNAGKRLAMLIGQGAKGAAAEVLEIADLLGAGIAKALLGKDVVPDTLPFVTGSIGLLGTRPSWDMMNECDTLFMVGSSFPYAQFMPPFGQARGVQIDIDGRMIGIRYPMEVNLIGDSRETLQALIPFIHRKEDRSWRQRLEEGVGKWWELVEDRAMLHADPINPAADLLGTELLPARQLHHRRRLRLEHRLVRPRRQAPRGDDGVALGNAGHDGLRHALRDRRQVRAIPTGPCWPSSATARRR